MALDWRQLPRDRLGDTPALQDELAALVAAGVKTASCSALQADNAGFRPGDLSVIEDSRGHAVCVVETLAVEVVRFCDVTADFARAEGEGDLSLEYWRQAHRDYFSRNGGFAEDMWLACETFRLVAVAEEKSPA